MNIYEAVKKKYVNSVLYILLNFHFNPKKLVAKNGAG